MDKEHELHSSRKEPVHDDVSYLYWTCSAPEVHISLLKYLSKWSTSDQENINQMSVLKYDKAILSVPANWAGPHMKMESTNNSTRFYKKIHVVCYQSMYVKSFPSVCSSQFSSDVVLELSDTQHQHDLNLVIGDDQVTQHWWHDDSNSPISVHVIASSSPALTTTSLL